MDRSEILRLTLPDQLITALKIVSVARGQSVSDFVAQLVREAIASDESVAKCLKGVTDE